jgi:hypothetical protein
MNPKVGIRWTIGDVSLNGFEALRLSVWGGWKIFGREADYVVCVNSLPLPVARERTGSFPEGVQWREVTHELAPFMKIFLDGQFAEGVGWKFAPLQLFPDRYELALDNDCILWEMPPSVRAWLEGQTERCVVAEDVWPCFGQFQHLCGEAPRNSGIRGLPPGYSLEKALRDILEQHPVTLRSELDEQGLQMAALMQPEPPLVVTTNDVSICSPFPPHLPDLGRYGAHFVGLNAKQLPWSLNSRPAVEYIAEHWAGHRPALYEKVGLNLI